jgi:nucleotide-binding universal stress UspA family protein
VDQHTLATAFLIARNLSPTLQGHIDALCVTPKPEIHAPVETASIPAALGKQLQKIAVQEQAEAIASARAAFEDFRSRFGAVSTEFPDPADASQPTAWWNEMTGALSEIVPEEARLSDLVVFAQDPDVVSIVGGAIEATLFNSGRPVLLAPAADPTSIGTACAIAWDGSSVASRAVRAALPFLSRAGKVAILTAERSDLGRAGDPQRLVHYLQWHGVTASVEKISAGHRAISGALTETAHGLGSDLLIMGAYGHSRVREMVLGGVTHDILRNIPSLPVLMAH